METDDSKLRKEAPLLLGLKKKKVFNVPDGFFRELEWDIRQKYPHRKKTGLRKIKRWAQFSAAAAITGLLLFSGFKTIFQKQYMPVETIRAIYTVQDGDMDESEP